MSQDKEKEEQTEVKQKSTGCGMGCGLIITIIYIISIALIIYFLSPITLSKIEKMGLNEWGDFLAGFFGPVAFLWLILGYRLQQNELKQNTEALHLQAQELRNTVEQYKEMVTIEKEKYETGKKESIARAKPLIKLEDGLLYYGDMQQQVRANVSIHNFGGLAEEVHISFSPKISENIYIPTITHTEIITQHLLIDEDSLPEELYITLSYKDAIGTPPYEQTYKLSHLHIRALNDSLYHQIELTQEFNLTYDSYSTPVLGVETTEEK